MSLLNELALCVVETIVFNIDEKLSGNTLDFCLFFILHTRFPVLSPVPRMNSFRHAPAVDGWSCYVWKQPGSAPNGEYAASRNVSSPQHTKPANRRARRSNEHPRPPSHVSAADGMNASCIVPFAGLERSTSSTARFPILRTPYRYITSSGDWKSFHYFMRKNTGTGIIV